MSSAKKTKHGRFTVKQVPLKDLIPYENNPRHNDPAVEAVAESIERFGFRVPIIVDKAGVIIAGHTRLKAAAQLGLDKVPVHVADDLTEKQARALRLADNKTAELAEWDMDLLSEELAALLDGGVEVDCLGFTEEEIASITLCPQDFETGTINEQGRLDELSPKIVVCPHCQKEFNVRGQM